jgi:MipA family protein
MIPRTVGSTGSCRATRTWSASWRSAASSARTGGAGGFGWLGVVAAGHRFGQRLDGLGTEVYGFLTFGTDDFINKDFGVTAGDAASSGLRQTTLGGGYRSAGVQVVHRRNLAPKLQAIAQAGLERYSGAISDSPIAREDFEYELSLALVWRF